MLCARKPRNVLRLLEVFEVICCVVLCMLETVEGVHYVRVAGGDASCDIGAGGHALYAVSA